MSMYILFYEYQIANVLSLSTKAPKDVRDTVFRLRVYAK